jgi:hypothetical protein
MADPVDTSSEAVEREANWLELHGATSIPALLRALAAERGRLQAECDRLRDALQKIAGISNQCTWTPKLRPLAAELQDIIRAALSQPPVKENGND